MARVIKIQGDNSIETDESIGDVNALINNARSTNGYFDISGTWNSGLGDEFIGTINVNVNTVIVFYDE